MFIPISSPDDQRIEDYRDIKERDLVGRKGMFMAEGEVVLANLVGNAAYRLRSLLICERMAGKLGYLLEKIDTSIPVYVAGRTIMDSIAGFPLHRGILALAQPVISKDAVMLLNDQPTLVMGLIGIANHDNMGGLFRNAAAFGASVLLDETCCDPYYRKALRVSVGGVLKTPFARCGSGDEMLDLLGKENYRVLALSPSGEKDLKDIIPSAKTALLFGAEGQGLPASLLDQVETIRISMKPGFDSLNVATSSGIALHALF